MIDASKRDRGSGTVLMVAVMALAGCLIAVTLTLASAIVARHRAGAIADLSALAAAGGAPDQPVQLGEPVQPVQPGQLGPPGRPGTPACARARRVAERNSGRLTGCRILADGSVLVQVELPGSGLPGPARGSARAGRAAVGPPIVPP